MLESHRSCHAHRARLFRRTFNSCPQCRFPFLLNVEGTLGRLFLTFVPQGEHDLRPSHGVAPYAFSKESCRRIETDVVSRYHDQFILERSKRICPLRTTGSWGIAWHLVSIYSIGLGGYGACRRSFV